MKSEKLNKKIISILVLAGLLGGEVSLLALSQTAQAQVINPFAIPTWGSGGRRDSVGVVELDNSKIWHEVLKGAMIAASNSAIFYFSRQLNSRLQSFLGIKSYRKYQAALVESKYLLESYSDYFGDNTVTVGGGAGSGGTCTPDSSGSGLSFCSNNQSLQCTTNADCGGGVRAENIDELATDAEGDLPGTAAQARELGARGARDSRTAVAKKAALQKQMVRASALFATSVVCGDINGKALTNMAEYMAGSAVGYTSKDINPRNGLEYYERMARFGMPEADKNFWIQGFKDNAAQKEADARSAAALELLGSGLKSPQITGADGKTQINKSQDLVASGLQKTVDSILNLPEGSRNSPFNTSSFKAFTTDVGLQLGAMYAAMLASKALNLIGVPPATVQVAVNAFVVPVSGAMASALTTKLYTQIGEMIFQGEFLEESGGCRKPAAKTPFTRANQEFTAPGNFTEDVELNPGQLIFQANPANITAGEIVTLVWDASSFGSGVTVQLSGGAVSGPQKVTDSLDVSPQQTTTYTLTVTGTGVNQTASVTVTVGAGTTAGSMSLSFDPVAIESDRQVRVNWDASSVTKSNDVFIDPLSGSGLAPRGSMCYEPDSDEIAAQSIDFTMVVAASTGVLTKTGSVSITAPILPRLLDFTADDTAEMFKGEFTTLTWNVGVNNARALLNGLEVPLSGSQRVGLGSYTLQVVESNYCPGVIAEQTITNPPPP